MKNLENLGLYNAAYAEAIMSDLNATVMEIYQSIVDNDLAKARWILVEYVDSCIDDGSDEDIDLEFDDDFYADEECDGDCDSCEYNDSYDEDDEDFEDEKQFEIEDLFGVKNSALGESLLKMLFGIKE